MERVKRFWWWIKIQVRFQGDNWKDSAYPYIFEAPFELEEAKKVLSEDEEHGEIDCWRPNPDSSPEGPYLSKKIAADYAGLSKKSELMTV